MKHENEWKNSELLRKELEQGLYDSLLQNLYGGPGRLSAQKDRYAKAIRTFEELFGPGEAAVFSAPGRSEIGGNHTDHQHGQVLAASIDLDAIAIARKTEDETVTLISGSSAPVIVRLSDLAPQTAEKESTAALIRGVLAGIQDRGYAIGGFQAYVTSNVLTGSGLSSSAAFEALVGTILSGLYNQMTLPSDALAIIGQYAENVYFGKPCGLMDQMACCTGGLIHLDFADPAAPAVEKLDLPLEEKGYCLCIVDTRGSHADLGSEYAAIPAEMRQAAACFGKEYLVQVSRQELLAGLKKVREEAGDRAALRAIHFIEENDRVRREADALKASDLPAFLKLVRSSGNSSFKFLQNVSTGTDPARQELALALAASEAFLDEEAEACRVHGGGFAGTIQAFVRQENAAGYQSFMDGIFGEGACHILQIRSCGGIRVM